MVSTVFITLSLLVVQHPGNSTLAFPGEIPSPGYRVAPAFNLDFDDPIVIAHPPGESNRLFVARRIGEIRVVPDLNVESQETFLDITGRVGSTESERGLLGLAFHPDYEENGYFFVFYTLDTDGAEGFGLYNRVSRFNVFVEDGNRGDPDSEVILIEQRDEAGNHNGGDIHFGPDGYLYIALGDEGGSNDNLDNSQRIDKDFFAGILRIDVDELPENLEPNTHPAVIGNYRVPADNPWVGATSFNGIPVDPTEVRTEFFAVGLRNPWRMSFDPATGTLWCADVGQGEREEVNQIRRGGNYGWKFREGFIETPGIAEDPPAGFTYDDPVHDYGRSLGTSVTGGLVYRGSRLAELTGSYIFADFLSGNIWSLAFDDQEEARVELLANHQGVVAFGVDPRTNDLLMADLFSGDLLRLVPETDDSSLPELLSETGAFSDLSNLTVAEGIRPYIINHPFWSDHAEKARWFSIPNPEDQIRFQSDSPWAFPDGMVWIKHFDMEMVRGDPTSKRRLETRFIIKNEGGAYGLTYRWNENQTDATLVGIEGEDEVLSIQVGEEVIEQSWRYPSRAECLACHTQAAGHALSFNTRQLNTMVDRINQILAIAGEGYFENPPSSVNPQQQLVPLDHDKASLEFRARSYIQVNCAGCHQPGTQVVSEWDGRISTPLDRAGILNQPPAGVNPATSLLRLIAPGDPDNSDMLQRISALGPNHMPPIATNVLNSVAVDTLTAWINSIPEGELWSGELGLKRIDWFGWIYDEGDPWIWHLDHGWLYTNGPNQESIFLYDRALGSWLWTNRTVYPWVYYFEPGATARWIWFNGPSSSQQTRWFWDPSLSTYFSVGTSL